MLAAALLLGVGASAGAQDRGADPAGEVEAMSYDFLLAISEPEDYIPGPEDDEDATPDVGAVALEKYAEDTGEQADVESAAGVREASFGAVDYTVAIRVATGFAEAAILDEIAETHIEVILPPVDLPMVDLAGGATMYRLLGDDAAAAIWYARLVEVSDDPINYFFYARALRALGHDELADEYSARYVEAQRRS